MTKTFAPKPNMTLPEQIAFNQSILAEALGWSLNHPMRAGMVERTQAQITYLESKLAWELHRAESGRLVKEARAAYAALPWYKKLFTAQP